MFPLSYLRILQTRMFSIFVQSSLSSPLFFDIAFLSFTIPWFPLRCLKPDVWNIVSSDAGASIYWKWETFHWKHPVCGRLGERRCGMPPLESPLPGWSGPGDVLSAGWQQLYRFYRAGDRPGCRSVPGEPGMGCWGGGGDPKRSAVQHPCSSWGFRQSCACRAFRFCFALCCLL